MHKLLLVSSKNFPALALAFALALTLALPCDVRRERERESERAREGETLRAAATTSRVANTPVSSTAAVYTQMTRRRAGPGTSENRLGVWAVFHIRALLAHVRALLAHIRALLAHIRALGT